MVHVHHERGKQYIKWYVHAYHAVRTATLPPQHTHTCGLLRSDQAVMVSREGMYSPAGADRPPTATPKFCRGTGTGTHKNAVLPLQ
jgi:hypothetical protein